MELSDEDLFSSSDENEIVQSSTCNPVAEHFSKQMYDTVDRVERTKSNVDQLKEMTMKVMKKLHLRETCGASSDSDIDSDSYQVTGEPVIKKKRVHRTSKSQPLEIESIWQKILDDKWILGILLKNTSDKILSDPRLYAIVKDQPEVRGISSFWEIIDSVSTRTDELSPDVDKIVATIVLELPNFADNEIFEAFGTISYAIDGKFMQTPVPTFRLRANDVSDKNITRKFSADIENSILATKSISVERELGIPIDKEGVGDRLLTFLEENGFKNFGEEIPDCYVARSNEYFRHCIFEILTINETEVPVRISARTSSHLEVVVRLLRDKFADVEIIEMEDRAMKAARALERELELELAGDDSGALHMARIVTDLLIP